MENLKRCPTCHILPEVKIEDKGPDAINVILTCEQHGHMAMGATLKSAEINWNLYVMFQTVKAA